MSRLDDSGLNVCKYKYILRKYICCYFIMSLVNVWILNLKSYVVALALLAGLKCMAMSIPHETAASTVVLDMHNMRCV